MSVYEQFKDRQRAVWGAGDWPEIAQLIQDVSDQVVERAGIAEGHDVLDVATGSGNAAIRAAERGARVTGLDLVPENVEAARRRAGEAGLEAWLEGTPRTCLSTTTHSTAWSPCSARCSPRATRWRRRS